MIYDHHPELGLEDTLFSEDDFWHTLGAVGYHKELRKIIAVFRGTDGKSLKNWWINLNFFRIEYTACAGCQVHQGFHKAYMSIQEGFLANVEALRAKYRSAPVVITGHSLGGAIAVLAALDLE